MKGLNEMGENGFASKSGPTILFTTGFSQVESGER